MNNAKPINDGGPAFPVQDSGYNTALHKWKPLGATGMSLRDWFAGQVLPAILRSYGTGNSDDIATECYQIADAMIAAREKGKE